MRTAYWDELVACSELFTCYSSALSVWTAVDDPVWPATLRTGLHLVVSEEDDGLFGFSLLPPGLGPALGLARRGADDADTAVAAIAGELEARGRVVVTGDGFHLPWHVARGRRHVPHWFTIVAGPDGPELADPFDCRTELGWQRPARQPLALGELAEVAEGLPGDDRVLALREAFALGADDRPLAAHRFGWLAGGQPGAGAPVAGVAGPAALRRLARHFQQHGDRADAYRQADDLWSVARHRAFFAHQAAIAAEDPASQQWVTEHLAPLAARWGHVAPLLMQARLGVQAGRAPSSSLPDVLLELADREARCKNGPPASV